MGAGHRPWCVPLFLLGELEPGSPSDTGSPAERIRHKPGPGHLPEGVEERELGLTRSRVLLLQLQPASTRTASPDTECRDALRAGGSREGVTGHLAGNGMQLAGNETQLASTPSLDGFILLPKALSSCSLEPAPRRAGRDGGRAGGGLLRASPNI